MMVSRATSSSGSVVMREYGKRPKVDKKIVRASRKNTAQSLNGYAWRCGIQEGLFQVSLEQTTRRPWAMLLVGAPCSLYVKTEWGRAFSVYCDVECGGAKSLYSDQKISKLRSRSLFVAYLILAFRAVLWTLTACEVSLIWSVNHLRSPAAHRILGIIVHPWADFPPKPHISLLFAIGWSISLLSLTIHLIFRSRYRRIRQSYASLEQPGHRVSRERIKVTRRIVHGSNPIMAIGSASCNVVPGSFAYECWVWRMRFGGTLFCLMGVSYVVFWLVMVIRRCVRSQRGGGTVSEPVEGLPLKTRRF